MDGRLKQVRKAKGYTQADMAAMLGYSSKSGYAMIENGRNVPKLHTAIRIARILDMDIEMLFGITPAKSMLDSSAEPMQQLESTQRSEPVRQPESEQRFESKQQAGRQGQGERRSSKPSKDSGTQ